VLGEGNSHFIIFLIGDLVDVVYPSMTKMVMINLYFE